MAKAFGKLKEGLDQDDLVTFGKYQGNIWFYVMENAPDYIIWCVGNTSYKFSYELLVQAIKHKYKIKKAAKTEEVDGVYDPEHPERSTKADLTAFPIIVAAEIPPWVEDDIPF